MHIYILLQPEKYSIFINPSPAKPGYVLPLQTV